MTDFLKFSVKHLAEARARLLAVPVLMRGGIVRTALRKGGLVVAKASIAATPQLSAPVFRNGRMVRRPGALKRAIKVRNSKDVDRTGDIGVFVNVKPLTRSAIKKFKEATFRPAADNPDENYFWRWVHFRTKRGNTPKPFLTEGGKTLGGPAFKAIEESLVPDINKLNRP